MPAKGFLEMKLLFSKPCFGVDEIASLIISSLFWDVLIRALSKAKLITPSFCRREAALFLGVVLRQCVL